VKVRTHACCVAALYAASRILVAICRERLLPPAIAWVWERTLTPVWCTLITGIICGVPSRAACGCPDPDLCFNSEYALADFYSGDVRLAGGSALMRVCVPLQR